MGSTQENPINVVRFLLCILYPLIHLFSCGSQDSDGAIPFSPTPVSALPPRPRPRPRLRRREAINMDEDGVEYIRGPGRKQLVIDPNVIEL